MLYLKWFLQNNCIHTAEVAGSIPASPTINQRLTKLLVRHLCFSVTNFLFQVSLRHLERSLEQGAHPLSADKGDQIILRLNGKEKAQVEQRKSGFFLV